MKKGFFAPVAMLAISITLFGACSDSTDPPPPPVVPSDSVTVGIANMAEMRSFVKSKKKQNRVYCVETSGVLPVIHSDFADLKSLNEMKKEKTAVINSGAGLVICPAAENVALTLADKAEMGVKITNASDTVFWIPKAEEQAFRDDPDNQSRVLLKCFANENQTVDVTTVEEILNDIDALIVSSDAGNTVTLVFNDDLPVSSASVSQLERLSGNNIKKSGAGILEPGEELVEIDGNILMKFNSVEPTIRAGFADKSARLRSSVGRKNWFYVPSHKNADALIGNKYGVQARTNRRKMGPNSSNDLNYLLPDTLQQSGQALDARGICVFDSLQLNVVIMPELSGKNITFGHSDERILAMYQSPKHKNGTSKFIKTTGEVNIAPMALIPSEMEAQKDFGSDIKTITDEGQMFDKIKNSHRAMYLSLNDRVFHTMKQKHFDLTFSENIADLSENGEILLSDSTFNLAQQIFGGIKEYPEVVITNKAPIALVVSDNSYQALEYERKNLGEAELQRSLKSRFSGNSTLKIKNMPDTLRYYRYSEVQGRRIR